MSENEGSVRGYGGGICGVELGDDGWFFAYDGGVGVGADSAVKEKLSVDGEIWV